MSHTRIALTALLRLALAGLLVLLAWLGLGAANARAATEFLEPQKAFALSARAVDARTVELRFNVAPGYYLYHEAFKFQAEQASLGPAQLPKGKVKFDETFAKDVETHRGEVLITLPVSRSPQRFKLEVVSQGCADAGLCYPPMTTEVQLSLAGFGGDGSAQVLGEGGGALAAAPGAAAAALVGTTPATASAVPAAAAGGGSESQRIEQLLRSGRFWAVVGSFALMGLLLSFTPCVLPMLPILSSIIAGSGERPTRSRALGLAASYSLGMALVYTLFGIAAGLAGEGLAAALQKPWVLATLAAALVVFALSMFDVFELRLPTAWQTGLQATSQRLRGGQVAGVFLMGGVSALVVSPCVTAPLAGALVFLSHTRDVWLGGAALFALAAGMSVPLLLLGASAGAWLPRSGAWMNAVKHGFGVMLLGVAIWVLQPALPPAVALALWGALLLFAGYLLRPFDPRPHAASVRVALGRALGLAALALGLMQWVGAASGGRDPLQPLSHLRAGGSTAGSVAPAFRPVRSVAELDEALRSAGRPVMLDFYADWCVSCKEMERFTFADPAVAALMSQALLLKADVTANTAADRELLRRFQLFGPPGTIFFDAQGREQPALRVVGFQDAQRFAQTLNQAGLGR